MKKLFLTLIAIVATCLAGFSQTTLADAYSSLASLSGMKTSKAETVQVGQNSAISNVKTASVSVSGDNIEGYRDKFMFMMENLPVRNMVMGVNNQREMATVYATPAGKGIYNVLILTGDTHAGNFSASYGQTDLAGIKAIRTSNVSMDSEELTVVSAPDSSADSFISMAK